MTKLACVTLLASLLIASAPVAAAAEADLQPATALDPIWFEICEIIFDADPRSEAEYCDKPRGDA